MKCDKLPALLIFKDKATARGKAKATNIIEREFKQYKDEKGHAYPRGVQGRLAAPSVELAPGARGGLGQQPSAEHSACVGLHRPQDGPVQNCDGAVKHDAVSHPRRPDAQHPALRRTINKLFKSNMSRLYDDYMATDDVVRNGRGYPDPPSRGCPRSG